MIHSVGIVDIIVDADAVDIPRRINLSSAARIIRARRDSAPVGNAADIAVVAAAEVDATGRVD